MNLLCDGVATAMFQQSHQSGTFVCIPSCALSSGDIHPEVDDSNINTGRNAPSKSICIDQPQIPFAHPIWSQILFIDPQKSEMSRSHYKPRIRRYPAQPAHKECPQINGSRRRLNQDHRGDVRHFKRLFGCKHIEHVLKGTDHPANGRNLKKGTISINGQ